MGTSVIGWILFGVSVACAMLLVSWLYRRRETPGRGRPLLAVLRLAALALVLLILLDPELPASGLGSGARGTQVLLDASLSMGVPESGSATRFERATAQARRIAGARDVLLFGDEVRSVAPDSIQVERPQGAASRLLPALQAASEAGVPRVVVLTDGRIEDAPEVARWLPRLAIDVDYRVIAEAGANAALEEVEAPGWAQAGEPLEVRIGVSSTGMDVDTVDVTISRGDSLLASESVVVAGEGRVAGATLRFTPSAADGGGLVRYDVRLSGAPGVADDDTRSIYVFVSEDPAGAVLVSLRPDWEPRFLQPVLQRALGIPVRGFLRTPTGRYIQTGSGEEVAQAATEEEVRRAIGQADLLVLHGVDRETPGWVRDVLAGSVRTLLLPSGDVGDVTLPVAVGRPLPAEWYLSDDVPASPVGSVLAGIDASSVPPLISLRFADAPAAAWSPLLATRGRSGPPQPLLLAGESAGRRWAVALGEGYWRWAFRAGAPREAYERLWGSIAGWLVQEQGAIASLPIRPTARVLPRGQPVRFVAPGLGADSVRIAIATMDGQPVVDSSLVLAGSDTVSVGGLPPGSYRYEATAATAERGAVSAEGEFTVESYSAEFSRPAVTLDALRASAVPVGPEARRRPGRPLHTAVWPFAAIILMVAAEWVLRRRWGLR